MSLLKIPKFLMPAVAAAIIYHPLVTLAQTPEALFEFEDVTDTSSYKADKGVELSVADQAGSKALKIVFEPNTGYPAVKLPLAEGRLDLSAYQGIQADITNEGQAKIGVGLRADNPGDWKKEPWNTETIYINPGETKTIKLTFGKSHGNKGYALDAGNISNVQIFGIQPKDGGTILVDHVKAFGTAAAANASAAAPVAGASESILVVDANTDPSSFKADNGVDVSVDSSKGAPALKVDFGTQGTYPAVRLPKPSEGWDLSKYSAVVADVENVGTVPVVVALRVDNPGDWKQNPWNTEMAKIAPGQKKKVTVNFGKSDGGNPGYPLDPASVSNIQFFSPKPPAGATVLVHGVSAVGTAKSGGAAAVEESLNAPAISGELLVVTNKTQPGDFETKSAAVTVAEANGEKVLNVQFQSQETYPALIFPIPDGGWNLAHYAGVQVDVTNTSDKAVMAGLRMDNPGDWKTEPWNTQMSRVGPGETKTIQAYFGKNNGAPGFPLNSANISKLQVFLEKPKQDTLVVVNNLKAFGTAAATATDSFTKPSDREKPVTIPAWVGTKPPVDGDWVQTLNENFDGATLDEKIWTPRLIWDGPAKGELQRYVEENVSVKDGVATILCEKRSGHQYNNPKLETREYTTGAFTSFGKWTQTYGYFEAKIKLPKARGLWPAFWTMPDRGEGNGDVWQRRETKVLKGGQGMEMDIFEHLTEWGDGRFNIAAHWDGYGPEHKQWGNSHTYYGPTTDGWHVTGMLWEPGKLTWFLDGKKVGEWVNERICDVPSYLKFTVQMGTWATKDVDDAKLPDKFQVDYVRAWQLKDRLPAQQ